MYRAQALSKYKDFWNNEDPRWSQKVEQTVNPYGELLANMLKKKKLNNMPR